MEKRKVPLKQNIKEGVKSVMQSRILPEIYNNAVLKNPLNRKKVILADAHHDTLPYSMHYIAEYLEKNTDYEVKIMCKDYGKGSYIDIMKSMTAFMKEYATAGYVIICDNHLPVASCKKRPDTSVIQLWHAGGSLKRFGYDVRLNIPGSYKGGNVYSNYDLVTVSAPYAVEVFKAAMRAEDGVVLPIGQSRTDFYHDPERVKALREKFYQRTPAAVGKKIVLWAPTFRGSASAPVTVGASAIREASKALGKDYYFIAKLHPHAAAKKGFAGTHPFDTQELLCVADILISDYSSVIYDFAYFEKPMILYIPDRSKYESENGFYEDYDSIPAMQATNPDGLIACIEKASEGLDDYGKKAMNDFYARTMSACDGHATERIVEWMRGRI